MKTNISVRKATSSDLPEIINLWKELMDFHSNLDSFYTRSKDGHVKFLEWIQKELENDSSELLVADSAGEIVGYIKIGVSDYPPVFELKQYGMIADTAVATEYRRQGIGALLLENAMDWFNERNIHRIELRVANVNPISGQFWQKMGFSPYMTTMFKEN